MKKFLKKLILYTGYLLHKNKNSKVIYYHDLGLDYTDMGTDIDMFVKHIEVVRHCGFKIVDEITEPYGQIMICFDDGWEGLYRAKDILSKLDIRPTVFVAVDLIGSEGHLNLEQINELKSMGVRFQGHSWSHIELSPLSEEQLDKEICSSKEKLQQMLGHSVDEICFPCGVFSEAVIQKCISAGYKKLYSSIHSGYKCTIDERLIGRKNCQYYSTDEVRFAILGQSDYLQNRCFKQHKK